MWSVFEKDFTSHLIVGTALFPSVDCMRESIIQSQAEIITVSLKRQMLNEGRNLFWEAIQALPCTLLPNTAGCKNAREAINMAEIAKEIFATDWIKLEVILDDYTLSPYASELLKAAECLVGRGFKVFPYCTDDLDLCQALVNVGCKVLMPWGAPIGSGQGLRNPQKLIALREYFGDVKLIIDAGIGRPSDAAQAMEMGFDAVLLNTAIAKAIHPIDMANAFHFAVQAGKQAYQAGIMPQRNFASPSTPLIDTPFWKQGATL